MTTTVLTEWQNENKMGDETENKIKKRIWPYIIIFRRELISVLRVFQASEEFGKGVHCLLGQNNLSCDYPRMFFRTKIEFLCSTYQIISSKDLQ